MNFLGKLKFLPDFLCNTCKRLHNNQICAFSKRWNFKSYDFSLPNPVRYLMNRHRDNCAVKYGDGDWVPDGTGDTAVTNASDAGSPHWEQHC